MTPARPSDSIVAGRLVLDDRVVPGRITVADGRIAALELDESPGAAEAAAASGLPFIAPGFVDVHVHGWGGHDALGDGAALRGMARALLRHGVTSFLPTAVSLPIPELVAFAERVRAWMPGAPADGAEPLGFNAEGPFLAPARKGAHNADHLRVPADVPFAELAPAVDGMRVMTIAPELPGALQLIRRLRDRGVAPSIGHSAASLDEARAGYAAGGVTTTHLFNAMTEVHHHHPGLAVAALTNDEAYVELIADGFHVHPSLWPIILRTKPADRLVLVSDALPFAGSDATHGEIGGLAVEIRDGACWLASDGRLAGSTIALDAAVRNLVAEGVPLPRAVAAASRQPLAVLGVADRGRLAEGLRADLVELDEGLVVRRAMRAGRWFAGAGAGTATAVAASA